MSKLDIYYNKHAIKNGEFIHPYKTKKEPFVKLNINSNEKNDTPSLYTLILYDPNSVSSSGTYIHWIVVNIFGNNIKKGNHIMPYVGPHPPKNTGIHNYTFELYKQLTKYNANISWDINERDMNINNLKTKLNLMQSTLIKKLIFRSSFYYGGKTNIKIKITTKRKINVGLQKTKRTK